MKGRKPGAGRRGMALGVFILLLLATVLLVAGCKIEIGVQTSINEDGSGAFGFRLAADKEVQNLLSQQGEGDLLQELKNNIPDHWHITQGTDSDDTRWVLGTVDFKDKEDLRSILQAPEGPVADMGQSSIDYVQETSFFRVVTRYTARFDVAAALTAIGQGAGEQVTSDILASVIDFRNQVRLPGFIGENNADEVRGNTLIWRLTPSGTTEMSAVSSVLRWPIVGALVVGGLVVIGLIVLLVARLRRRRRPTPPPPRPAPPADQPSWYSPLPPSSHESPPHSRETRPPSR